mgnify:FL=1
MANKNLQKLELTWIGKGEEPKLEPRILIENPEHSYGDSGAENILIHGDNLLALKALEQDYAGKIKCIYIDPPYNTGNAFEHYDDGLEHSIWLNLMTQRLKILKKLLKEDGTIFVQLDDNEIAYCRVIMDEIFGRNNFINQVSVKMKQTAGASGGGEDKKLKKNIEYILIYTKNIDSTSGFKKFNDVYEEEDLFEVIQTMKDAGKSWKYTRIITGLENRNYIQDILDGSGEIIKVYEHVGVIVKPLNIVAREENISIEDAYKKHFDKVFRDTNAQSSIRTRVMDSCVDLGEFVSIDYIPKSGKNKNKMTTVYYKGNNRDQIAWLKDIAVKRGTKLVKLEKLGTYWEGFPLNNLTKEGGVQFPNGKKPELLLKTVLDLASKEGDFILDSFAGSGTTAAVAHKMKRKWITIELGEHAYTHCLPRLKKVIDGEDNGGITTYLKPVWQGGGGFKFYTLAPSLLKKDKFNNWVISEEYNPDMLAAAMAKQEGFKYQPHESVFWKQGNSTEQDFIFTTTQFLTVQQVEAIAEGMQPEESLLICCKAFQTECQNKFKNITIKKIPLLLLEGCEFGKDDYSLNIVNVPFDQEEYEDTDDLLEDDNNEDESNLEDTNNNAKTLFD